LFATPRSLRPFETRTLPQVFCDVLVLGAGIAGQVAALTAAESGARVLLLTKADRLESNTLYAQGGVAAAVAEADSEGQHVADTIAAGDGLCHADVVESVVAEGRATIDLLEQVGVQFDHEASGALALAREGGHAAHRVAHASGDLTGREIQRALGAALVAARGVQIGSNAFAVELLVDDGACVGALIQVRGEVRVVWASAVILATGGAAPLFRESTNPRVTTGDGIAMAYRAGARLRDMEFMQFHPTVLYVPGAARRLISEAARGEGALILDTSGERFLPAVDPRAELAPRDIVSRGIMEHLIARGDTHALLDLTVVDADRLRERLPGVLETGRCVGIDATKQPLPIRPAAHYTIGGVVTDLVGQTSLPGLVAAGEVTSTGLHGANRLASNSLLEASVFGVRAGRAAAERASAARRPRARDLSEPAPGPGAEGLDVQDILRSIKSLTWRNVGLRRHASGLELATAELAAWAPLVLGRTFEETRGMEAQNLCILAGLTVEAASMRRETRGVHWRSDFPDRRDDFRAHIEQVRGEPPRLAPLLDPVEAS
jgi:L-aspartate oxidase